MSNGPGIGRLLLGEGARALRRRPARIATIPSSPKRWPDRADGADESDCALPVQPEPVLIAAASDSVGLPLDTTYTTEG